MRSSSHILCVVVPLLAAALPRESRACQPPPEDLMGFATSSPSDGAVEVPVDAGIALFGTAVVEAGYGFAGEFALESLALLDADGQAVTGHTLPWRAPDDEPVIAWAPLAPLAPGSTYTLSAEVDRGFLLTEYTEEQLALGATLATSFTTGTSETAPLSTGALELATTVREVDLQDCPVAGDCGTSCVVVGTRTYPELVITVPEVAGGNDAAGYSAYFAVGAGAPLPFTGIEAPAGTDATPLVAFTLEAIASAGPTSVSLPLYVTDQEPFVPCVSAIVWDPSGKSRILEPVCAAETVTPPTTDGAGGAGGNGGAAGSSGLGSGAGGAASAPGGAAGSGGTAGDPASEAGSTTGGASDGGGGGEDAGPIPALGDGGAGSPPAASDGGAEVGGETSGGPSPTTGGSVGDPSPAAAGRDGTATEPPAPGAASPREQGGCSGCRTAPTPASRLAPLLALAAALLGRTRRRRRALTAST